MDSVELMPWMNYELLLSEPSILRGILPSDENDQWCDFIYSAYEKLCWCDKIVKLQAGGCS